MVSTAYSSGPHSFRTDVSDPQEVEVLEHYENNRERHKGKPRKIEICILNYGEFDIYTSILRPKSTLSLFKSA